MTVTSASAPKPRRGRPGYDQATVLSRAIDLFNRQGYDATSMGDLAKELGLSKSAIYYHVPSKEHLLKSALDEALDNLELALDRARENLDTTPIDRLRSAVKGGVKVLVEHLPAVTLLLRVRGNSEEELAALQRRRRIDNALAAMVRAAVEDGALRDDIPPNLISRLLFGTVNSLVEWVRPDGKYSADLLAESLTSMAFDGLVRP